MGSRSGLNFMCVKGYPSVESYRQVSITWVYWDETIRCGAGNNCATYFWLALTSLCTKPHSSHSMSFLYKQKSTYRLNRKTEKETFVFFCSLPIQQCYPHLQNLWTSYCTGTLQSFVFTSILFLQRTLVLHLPKDRTH